MSLLPEWAPNLHPFLVHFPIALLVTAVAVEWAGIVSPRSAARTSLTTVLYLAGTIALFGAYLTGRDAAETVLLPGMAHAVVTDHWSWAVRCLWVFVGLTALRLGRRGHATRDPIRLLLATGGLVGLALLVRTADLGGQLVYEHGVGTVQSTEIVMSTSQNIEICSQFRTRLCRSSPPPALSMGWLGGMRLAASRRKAPRLGEKLPAIPAD